MGKKKAEAATPPPYPTAKPGDVVTWVPSSTYADEVRRMYGTATTIRDSSHVYLGRLRSADREVIVARALATGGLYTFDPNDRAKGAWKVHGSNEDVQLTLER